MRRKPDDEKFTFHKFVIVMERKYRLKHLLTLICKNLQLSNISYIGISMTVLQNISFNQTLKTIKLGNSKHIKQVS